MKEIKNLHSRRKKDIVDRRDFEKLNMHSQVGVFWAGSGNYVRQSGLTGYRTWVKSWLGCDNSGQRGHQGTILVTLKSTSAIDSFEAAAARTFNVSSTSG
jgi:hypothetical protein